MAHVPGNTPVLASSLGAAGAFVSTEKVCKGPQPEEQDCGEDGVAYNRFDHGAEPTMARPLCVNNPSVAGCSHNNMNDGTGPCGSQHAPHDKQHHAEGQLEAHLH